MSKLHTGHKELLAAAYKASFTSGMPYFAPANTSLQTIDELVMWNFIKVKQDAGGGWHIRLSDKGVVEGREHCQKMARAQKRDHYDSVTKATSTAHLVDALKYITAGGARAPSTSELGNAIRKTQHALLQLEAWAKDRGEV